MPEVTEQVVEQPTQTAPAFNPFGEWAETPAETIAPQMQEVVPAATTTAAPTTQEPAPAVAETNEDVFDENVYVKNKFGWESAEAGLAELKAFREAKEKGIEFANDDSKRLFEYIREGKEDEAYDIIHRKKTVEKLLKADVTDKSIAEQVIKLGMKNDTAGLSDAEIDHLYKKKFSTPAKPEQTLTETDEEYAAKVSSWESFVKDREMDLMIEAKITKPKLEKLKADLILPEIKKEEAPKSNEFSQEELANIEAARQTFLKSLETSIPKFNGYETKCIGEDAEIPVAYLPTEEEKVELKKSLEDFDLGTFIQERWFSKMGEYDVSALAEDIFFLRNKGKILQKLATDAGAKRLADHIRKQSNIHLTNEPTQTGGVANTPQEQQQKEVAFLWSQK